MSGSKITEKFVMTQLQRLAAFYGAPKSSGGWKDSAKVLVENVRDEDHCVSVIDRYVEQPRLDEDGNPKFPNVFELRELCLRGRAPSKICPLCNGDGFVLDRRVINPLDGRKVDTYRRCSCDRQASFEDRAAAGQYRPEAR